jgi:hypothetical protein
MCWQRVACKIAGLVRWSGMDRLFWVTLVVIVALGVRLLLEMAGRPKQLAEPAAMTAILASVALALSLSWIYSLMETLVFLLSLVMIALIILGIWFYVLQPMAEAADTNLFQGLNLGSWNARWDYLGLLLLGAPVFVLILTYNYFASFFDFAIGRLLPLSVLGFIYFYAIVRRW